MENLKLEASKYSPSINFNAETGILEISGNSGAFAVEEYERSSKHWVDMLNWLELYLRNPQPKTTFICKLKYFDTATPQYLLKVFRALEVIPDPYIAEIIWHVEKGDDNMLEFIDDLNRILKRLQIRIVEE